MFLRLFFRVLLWAVLFYLLFRVLRVWARRARLSGQGRVSVHGQPRNKPLDLRQADVEDAKFHELKK